MNRQNTKKLLPIIEAFANGKNIEYRANSSNEWEELKDPNFECDLSCYRIKPDPKLIPFTFEDNLIGQCLITKASKNRSLIIGQLYDGVYIGTKTLTTRYVDLLKDFEFEDGSPCGKYVNE